MNNDEFGSQINYSQLLQRHGRIRIPMIQRDYAQGRPSEQDVREGFLNALESALKLPADAPTLPLNLDFIYGSVEGERETRFAPLDGQQRLTTLFLLHWFLAWQDGAWEEFGKLFRCGDGHSRFSYSVRPSSNEFFDKLVFFQPERTPEQTPDLSAHLSDRRWYFRHWRLDPTIQSALTVLDAIHRRFKGSRGLFARLTSENQPTITFQLLDLKNFGLSDDLYIKMNARGKPLTAFETFKARYEQGLKNQFAGRSRRLGDRDYSVAEFVALRLDTAWADFFWAHRDPKTNLHDEAIMNLFRVLAIITRDPEAQTYLKDVELLRDQARLPAHTTFHTQGWLDEAFTEALIALLECWGREKTAEGGLRALLPDTRVFDETAVFGKLIANATNLTLTEVTQFAAYVHFLRVHGVLPDEVLPEWMRVVRNLAVNTNVERSVDLLNTARGLRGLLPGATQILEHLTQPTSGERVTGFSGLQAAEERLKAGLLLADSSGWRPLIERAENHGYFRGQIGFLLDFCGAVEEAAKTSPAAWDAAIHRRLQSRFEHYLRRAEGMFNDTGLNTLGGDFRWERALLTLGDYLLPSERNFFFPVDGATNPASWKRLLRDGSTPGSSEAPKRKLLQQLWDRLVDERPTAEQLDEIIAAATGLPPWREAFVRTPAALAYCESRAIRRESEDRIYLLSKKQMNGWHTELFTFCLHQKLDQAESKASLRPLELRAYGSRRDRDDEPHMPLRFPHGGSVLEFMVIYWEGRFQIWIDPASLTPFPSLRASLVKRAGFVVDDANDQWLVKNSSPTEIETTILDLAKLLASLREPLRP